MGPNPSSQSDIDINAGPVQALNCCRGLLSAPRRWFTVSPCLADKKSWRIRSRHIEMGVRKSVV